MGNYRDMLNPRKIFTSWKQNYANSTILVGSKIIPMASLLYEDKLGCV